MSSTVSLGNLQNLLVLCLRNRPCLQALLKICLGGSLGGTTLFPNAESGVLVVVFQRVAAWTEEGGRGL